MSFAVDGLALFAVTCLLVLLFVWRYVQPSEKWRQPVLFFSDYQVFKGAPSTLRLRFATLPLWLLWSALACFLLAFVDPRFFAAKSVAENLTPTEGIAIYLVLDRSGSMKEQVKVHFNGKTEKIAKIDLLRQITEQFVNGAPSQGLKGRPEDLIGLVAFARTAQVLTPLTLNHQAIVEQLKKLQVVPNPEEDGTSIGYAIYKTVNLIVATKYYSEDLSGSDLPAYHINSAAIILVTDGFNSPNKEDQGNALRTIEPFAAAEYAKTNGVRLYLVTIDPALSSNEFAPHRRLMQNMAHLTGGEYYLISDTASLGQIYADIDRLEKSAFPIEDFAALPKEQQPHRYRRISLFPYLIGSGMLFLLCSLLLSSTWFRRVP